MLGIAHKIDSDVDLVFACKIDDGLIRHVTYIDKVIRVRHGSFAHLAKVGCTITEGVSLKALPVVLPQQS